MKTVYEFDQEIVCFKNGPVGVLTLGKIYKTFKDERDWSTPYFRDNHDNIWHLEMDFNKCFEPLTKEPFYK